MDSVAAQSGLLISAVTSERFTDPEDESQEIIIQVTVKANAAQALAYWNSLGKALNRFTERLPAAAATSFLQTVSVQVFWPDG